MKKFILGMLLLGNIAFGYGEIYRAESWLLFIVVQCQNLL